jgi:hypothetical protein
MYKQIMKIKGALRTPVIKEVPSEKEIPLKKGKDRQRIEEAVFDIPDSVADNAKMISLLLSILSRVYGVLDDTQKDQLTTEDRELIENTFDLFQTIDTRADKQFQAEGFGLVEKLMRRQQSIADIIEG